jgi:hypothetical protein
VVSAKDARATRAIKWGITFLERMKGRDIARAQGRVDLRVLVRLKGHRVISSADIIAVVPKKSFENNLSDATYKRTFRYLTKKELVVWMGCPFGDQFNGSRNAGTRGMLATKSGGEVTWCDLATGDTRYSYGKARILSFLI